VGICECGKYVESVKPEIIANAIASCYDLRTQLDELGVRGRTLVKEKYSWQKVGQNLEAYLLSIEQSSKIY
jgi:glycosyltransferase involved in cell wall biosynthesis